MQIVEKMTSQLLEAINFMHTNYSPNIYIHADIKPNNVLLDKHLNVHLGDFDMTQILSLPKTDLKGFYGTIGYMSPVSDFIQSL